MPYQHEAFHKRLDLAQAPPETSLGDFMMTNQGYIPDPIYGDILSPWGQSIGVFLPFHWRGLSLSLTALDVIVSVTECTDEWARECALHILFGSNNFRLIRFGVEKYDDVFLTLCDFEEPWIGDHPGGPEARMTMPGGESLNLPTSDIKRLAIMANGPFASVHPYRLSFQFRPVFAEQE